MVSQVQLQETEEAWEKNLYYTDSPRKYGTSCMATWEIHQGGQEIEDKSKGNSQTMAFIGFFQ
jgi:hypothetical protein